MTRKQTPLHIGISFDASPEGDYVITAEYKDGYIVCGRYASLDEAKTALPMFKLHFRDLVSERKL